MSLLIGNAFLRNIAHWECHCSLEHWLIQLIFKIFGQILRFLIKIICFSAPPGKMMQNHYEISSKTLFWNQNMQISTKSPDLDMSGSEKSWFGHVRTWKVVIWTCPDLKSCDLDMSGPEKFGHVRTKCKINKFQKIIKILK